MKLLVLAKAPVPGRVKTRLTPPLTPSEAATVAEAALADTLDVVADVGVGERILLLDGDPGPWMPDGFRVVPQRGDGLDERLSAAFADVDGGAVLIGMDTPQVTPALLEEAIRRLEGGADAVLGEAADGGWWILGVRERHEELLLDVPMSSDETCEATRARLRERGLRWEELPILRDVDTVADLPKVAAEADADSRFVLELGRLNGSVTASRRRASRVTAAVLGAGILLIAAAHGAGRWLRWRGHRMAVNAPPLTGNLDPSVSWSAIPAVVAGALATWRADRHAQGLRWRVLLIVAFAAAAVWALALGVWEGTSSLTRAARASGDYLSAMGQVGDDPLGFVRTFLTRLDAYPTHVRAHPPGIVLALWGTRLHSPLGATLVELVAAASAVPAALLAIRDVAGEARARAAAPFLVVTPAAMWWTTGDGLIMATCAWASVALILATSLERSRRARRLLSLAGGTLVGAALFLSIATVLAMLVPAAVIGRRRAWSVPVVAAAPVAAWIVGFWAVGYPIWQGQAAIREQYAESLARIRPYGYFVWANLAAFAVAIGPAVWVATSRLRDRRLWLVVGAAIGAVVLADLSGLTKAEVERIWLPFALWVSVAAATLDGERARRGWLAAQTTWALVVQLIVRSPW